MDQQKTDASEIGNLQSNCSRYAGTVVKKCFCVVTHALSFLDKTSNPIFCVFHCIPNSVNCAKDNSAQNCLLNFAQMTP